MASAASNQTVGSASETQIFNAATDLVSCTTLMVRCRSGSANGVLVNIPGLHKAGEYCAIPAGDREYFRLNDMGMKAAFAKGDGGNASIDWAVVSNTQPSN